MAKPVKVVWMDALCLENLTQDDLADLELNSSTAFGWLIHEAKDFIAIAQVVHPDGVFKNVLLIPRNSIIELVELTEEAESNE